MYCVQLTIQPTAAMTFRILPGSILNIATYPFAPPTTVSGYLRRLGMLSVGLGIPETGVNTDNPPIYALPPRYIALGAYPENNALRGVHQTYRKGMREFNHDDFSKLYSQGNTANFQLHTWEYLITEELVSYVLSDSEKDLEDIQDLQSYGCKFGKEGFAFVREVSDILPLTQERISAHPSTLVPMDDLLQTGEFIHGCDIYNLYRYNWDVRAENQSHSEGFLDDRPTDIDGFLPFVGAYFAQQTHTPPTLDYYTDRETIFIPTSLVQLLKGTNHA